MNTSKFKSNFLNTLDIALIIVAISILVATVYKMNNKKILMLFDKSKDVTVTLSCTSDSLNSGDFAVGDKIFFSDGKDVFGTITSVKNIKEKRYAAINQTLMYDYTDRNVGVLIEVETKIKENQSKKYINSSVFLALGKKYSLYTKTAPASEFVVDDIYIIND